MLAPASVAVVMAVCAWRGFGLSGPARHAGRVWFSWAVACAVGAVVADVDAVRLRRGGGRLTLPVAVADVLLSFCAAATFLGPLVAGGWGALFAVAVGAPATAAALFVRVRTGRGHLDGPAAVVLALALAAWGAHARPWTPRSGQWTAAAAIAAAAAAAVCWTAARDARACRRGRRPAAEAPGAGPASARAARQDLPLD